MHSRARLLAAIVTAAAVVAAGVSPIAVAVADEPVAPATGPIAVGSAADAGAGTLRAAIEEANARPGADAITVAVGEPITVSSPLPAITDAVTIDTAHAELRGAGGGAGFTVLADDVSIAGFAISGFATGVTIDRASRVTITRHAITDNAGSGVAIIGPTKEEVAAALGGGTITLEGLTALVPTDVEVRGNTFARNGGPAVTRAQEGVIAIDTLTRDAVTVRGTVRDAAESPSVEIFASGACDGARPQAETLLGTAAVAADGTFELAIPADAGEVTALPSDGLSGTGAISGCAQPAPAAPAPTTTTTTTTTTAPEPTAPAPAPTTPAPEGELAMSGFAAAPAADECTVKWNGLAGTSSWHDELNWGTGSVPKSTDVVCIPDGVYVLYLTGTSTVAKLQVDGSLTVVGGSLGAAGDSWAYEIVLAGGTLSAAAEVSVTNKFNWTGGTLTGTGTLHVGAGASGLITDSTAKTLAGHLRNDGSLEWVDGTINLSNTLGKSHLDNYGTLTVSGDDTTDWSAGSCCPLITNRPGASIVKTGAATATLGDEQIDFVNDGTVTVQAGTLWLDVSLAGFGGSDITRGTWVVDDSATLKIWAANFVTNATTIELGGPNAEIVDHTGADAFRSFATNSGTLTLRGRSLNLPGSLDNNGTLALWPGSVVKLAGDFTNGGGSRLEYHIAGTVAGDDFGVVNPASGAYLGGTIEATLINGFVPDPGDELIVLDSSNLSGTFDAVEGDLYANYDYASDDFFFTLSDPYPNCDAVFTNGGGTGSWHYAPNWDSGYVPSGDDRVCIPSGLDAYYSTGTSTAGSINGDGELTVSGGSLAVMVESSIGRLDLQGGTFAGDGDLTVTESFSWTTGTLAGAGTLVVDADATAGLTGSTKTLSRHLRNEGALTWADGTIIVRSDLGGVAHLDNYGALTISGDDDMPWWGGVTPPTITNRSGASIVKTGSYTATLGSYGSGFVNDGTVTVSAGGLEVNCSTGCGGAGDWNLTGDLEFLSGEWDISGDVSGAGTLTISTDPVRISGTGRYGPVGWTTLDEGVLDVDSTPALPNTTGGLLIDGDLTGDGDLTVTEMFNWQSGEVLGTGTLTVADTAVGYISSTSTKTLGRHLRNDAGISWSEGTMRMRTDGDGAAHLENYGILNLSGTVSTDWYAGATPPAITNRAGGLLRKSGSWTTTATIGDGVVFSNEGAVSVEDGGTLFLDTTVAQISVTTLTGGKWEVVQGTLMVKDLSVVTNQAEIVMWGCCNLIVDQSWNDAVENVIANNEGVLSAHHKDFDAAVSFTNSGTIRLDPWSNIDVQDEFVQTSTGRLEVEISGVSPDGSNGTIETNSATLAGTLESILVPPDGEEDPYEPGPGDEFTVIWADTFTGTFSPVEGPLGVTYDPEVGVVLSLGGSTGSCTVTWDGGGLTTNWGNAANWSPDGLPGPSDVVCTPAESMVVHSTGTTTVAGIHTAGGISVVGSTLAITGESDVGYFNVAGGTLSGAGNLTVTHAFTWTEGQLQGSGVLTVAAGATGSWSGVTKYLDRHLVNEGSVTWSDGSLILHGLSGGGHLDNYGTFTISGDDSAPWLDGGAAPKITNRPGASIVKMGPGAAALGGGGVEFVNDGTVTSVGGTLQVGGAATNTGGSGTWILLGGGITFSAGTWELAGDVSGIGTLGVTGGTVRMSGGARLGPVSETSLPMGTLDLDNAPASPNLTETLTVSGGVLTGDGDLAVSDAFSWTQGQLQGSGVLRVGAEATGSLSGSATRYLDRHLVNEGSVTWSDGPIVLHGLAGGGHLDNYGTFAISGDDSAPWYDGGAAPKITNRPGASILKTGTGAATLGNSGVETVNDGTVRVTGGTLLLGGDLAGLSGTTLTGGEWIIDDGATLRVRNASIVTNAAKIALSGMNADFQDHTGMPVLTFLAVNDGELRLQDWHLALPNDLTNNGVLALRSAGVDVLGAFTQSAGGRLEVGVSGPVPYNDYGRVWAWGGATIGGTISADLLGGYTPGPGDEFTVIDAASLTGTFATVEGDFQVGYDVPNGDVILSEGVAGDCNVDWDGGAATTSWHDAANWNPDTLPGPSDVVCIPAGVTVVHSSGGATTVSAISGDGALDLVFGSLSIADESQIDTLIVGGGGTFTGAGNMTVTNAFTWTGGELTGLGTLTVASGASGSLSGGAGKWLGRHVRNDGSLVWSDGPLYMRSDGDRDPHLDNYGTFTISGDDYTSRQQGTAVPRITNRSGASIVKTGAGSTTLGDGGAEFVNDGTVTSVEGTLRVGGGAASGGPGTWDLLGGNVTFDAGTWELTGDVSGIGTVTVPSGTIRVSGSARYAVLGTVISGGTLDLDNTPVLGNVATDLEVSWGILTGDSDLLVNEQFTWTGGELTGLGTLTVDCAEAPLCSLEGPGSKMLGRHVRNDGSLVWSDGLLYVRSDGDRDPQLDNYGTFTISGDDYMSWQQGTAAPRITNRSGASIVKTGAGTATLGDGGTEFVNDGTVASVEGTLRVGGGAASGGSGTWGLLGGNVTFHAGAWGLTGDVSGIGTVTVPSGTTVRMSGSGRYAVLGTVISGGTLDLDNTPALDNVATDLAVSSGLFTGDGDLLVNEQLTWTGGELTGLGTLTVDCAEAPLCSFEGPGGKWLGRHVRNDGSLVWSDGTIYMRSDGDRDPQLDNYGTFTISGDDYVSRQQGTAVPRITNRSGASIVKTGAGTATLGDMGDSGTEFVNDGTVTSVEGTLRVGGGAASGGSGTWGLLGGNVTFYTGMWGLTGDVSGIGTVTVSGGTVRMSGSARWGTVTDTVVSGGTLDLDDTPAIENLTNSLTVSSGVLTGDGDLLVDEEFTWTGGELTGLGTLTVASGASGSLSGAGGKWLGRHVRNDGSSVWSDGPIYMRSDGDRDPHLDNYGTFTISGDDPTSRQQGTAVPRITNRSGASIVKTGAAGATLGDSGTEFVNGGEVWATAGTLRLNGALVGLTGTTLTGGTWNVADGATLRVNNANVVTNAADIALLGPNAAFEDHAGANALRNLAVNNGELSLQGKDLALGGDLTNNGILTLQAAEITLAGGFTQTATGRLEVAVSGPVPGIDYGRVLAGAGATVDGTIFSDLIGGYTPGAGDTFTVIDAASLTGTFATVEGDLPVTYDVPNGDVVLGAGSTGDCTATWDGGASTTSWHDAANWAPDGVPGAGDVVCIPEGVLAEHSSGATAVAAIKGDGGVRLDGGSLETTDTSTDYSIGALDIFGGTFTADGNLAVDGLLVAGGILTGAGDVTAEGVLAWTGGELAGSGRLVLAPDTSNWMGGSLTLGRHLVNQGSLHIGGDPESPSSIAMSSDGDRNPHLDNYGTFELLGSDVDVGWSGGSTAPLITNRPGAEIVKTQAGSVTLGSGGVHFTNDGAVTSLEGTLGVVGGTLETGGTGTWSMLGGDIKFGGGWWELRGDVSGIGTVEVSAGFVRMAGSARFGTVDGVVLSGGALDLDNAPAQPNAVNGLLVSGGELRGDGDLTVSGVLAWTGGELAGSGELTLASGTANWIDGSVTLGRHLVNQGALHIGGDPESPSSIAMSSDGDRNPHLDNYGTFELIGSDVEVAWTDGWATPVITNRPGGEIVKVSAGTITLGNVSTLLVNEGTVTVEEGTLNLDGVVAGLPETLLTGGGWIVLGGATLQMRDADVVTNAADIALQGLNAEFVDDNGANALRNLAANYGTLSLAGVDLALAGDLTNGGTLKLDGSEITLPGEFTQTAAGTLEVVVSGPVPGIDYGRVLAAGGATLDGGLTIVTADGYSPTSGTFTIVDAATLTGEFATVEGTDIGNGFAYHVQIDEPNGDVVLAIGVEVGDCTVTWDGGALTTSWHDAANWGGDTIPGPSDIACIPGGSTAWHTAGTTVVKAVAGEGGLVLNGGTFEVTDDSAIGILAVGGATLTGAGDLTVNAVFVWGAGELAGGGELRIASGAAGTIITNGEVLGRHLVNYGSLVWSEGDLELSSDGDRDPHLDNYGTFEITGVGKSAVWSAGAEMPRVTNRPGATITSATSDWVTVGEVGKGVELVNDGTVTVASSKLVLSAGGASGGSGSWVAAGGNLVFGDGTWELTGSMSGAAMVEIWRGTVRLSGAGRVDSLGTMVLGGVDAVFDVDSTPVSGNALVELWVDDGGTLTGDGDLSVTGSLLFSGGDLAGAGRLTIEAGAEGSFVESATLGRHLVNEGTLRWQDNSADPGGTLSLSSDGDRHPHLDNYGTLEIAGVGKSAVWSAGAEMPRVTNRPGATITSATSDWVTVGVAGSEVEFVNDGTVTVAGSKLVLRGGGASGGSGSWVAAGGNLVFADGAWELTGPVSGAGTVEVWRGTVRLSGAGRVDSLGTMVLGGVDAVFDVDSTPVSGSSLVQLWVDDGGTLTGDGDVSVTGSATLSGGELAGSGRLTIGSGAEGTIIESPTLGRHLVNEGTLTWTDNSGNPGGSLSLSSDGDRDPHLDNYGTLEISGVDKAANWTAGVTAPRITNRFGATITKAGSGTATLGDAGVELANEGAITVEDGTLNLDGMVVGLSGTTLTGGGWIVMDGATLQVRDADVVTNAADIALLGLTAAFVDHDGANALRNLAVNSGTLSLAGADLALSGSLANAGTLKLDGSDVTLPGDFSQSAAGRFEIPISGPVPGVDYGRIVAAGGAAIDGTLAIITVDPFSPTDGVFTIIDATSVSGEFAAVEGADIGNGSSYQVRIDVPNGDVVLAVGETAHLAFVGDVAISETETDLDVGFELDRPLGVPVLVHFETVAGSATPGEDYTAVTGTTTVPAGETTGNVVVPLLEDGLYEGAESFTVRITGADAGTNTIVLDDAEALVTILDDEEPILPTVQILPQSEGEAAGSFIVEVKGSGGNTPGTFPFQVFAGTAVAPDDYSQLLTPSTVTVPANGSAFVAVPLVSDLIDEDDEVFTVDVAGTVGTMTIIDDDLPPVAVIDGLTITEGDDGTIDADLVVRLVDPFLKLLPQESGRIVTVAADTLDGTALAGDDYVATSGVVAFSPGQTTRTFAVPVVGDEVDEDTETFAVDLDALTNVTVADDEGATVTIVDDDGTGNADEIAQQLETGSTSLFDGLDEWGDAFDLDQFDASDPEMFEVPGLTDDLARLFEPRDDLGGLSNPFQGLSDDLEALCDQLEALGVTIDWVEGGACGAPSPPTGPDIFQVRYEVTLTDLAQALGFSGDELNDDMQGALEGLASALDLDADFTPLADLVVTLVVGVDEAGFYVSSESGLRLDIGATGTVTGGGTVAGAGGLTVEGTATVNLSVSLTADRGAARLRVAHLAGSPLAYLRPSATGTVELGLGAALEPATLDWTGAYTLTVDETLQTTTELTSTLEAALTLPGITENGDPTVFTMAGTYENSTSTWTLTGGGDVGSGYALYGFDIEELGLELVLTPDSFGGSASFAMNVDLGGPETPLTLDCDATFDDTTFHAECHLAFDEANLGLVYLGAVTVGGVFDGDMATGEMTGGIDVAADTLVLLPQTAPPGTEPEGAGRAEDVTGSLDSDGNLALHAGLLTGSIGGEIDFEIEGVDFSLPPTGPPPGRVFSVGLVEATIPSLDGLGVTLTGFHLNGDGTFGAEGVGVTSQGFLQTIGLAGILPFDITEVEATFPDWEDLDTFLVEVTGHFDFTTLAALPFTPEIGLGGDPVTPSSPPEDNVFSFTIAVDSLSEGEVRPWDAGPITLGFDDLEIGEVTLGAQLTLGGYELGEWVDDFGGTLSVESGLDGIVGDASVDVTGSLDVTPGAAALDLTGTFSISANLSDDVRIEGASLDFALGVSVDDAWQFTITGPNLTGAGIDRIEIAFGDFMRLVGTGVDIDFSPAPGDPLIAFGGVPCEPGEEPPCDGSLAVEFEEEFEALAGWGGEAGNFAIDADFTPVVLPGFFLNVWVPDGEHFGLPEWLPVRVDEVGIRFPDVDFENIPPEGLPISDLAAFAIRFSGGIEANETWPISAAVDGLEVDLGKLVNFPDDGFPITNLDGFEMGVKPFELVPGFEIGGGLELKTIEVDGDPAPGEQLEDVFYGRIYGQFEYEGLGAGVDLVVSQYGPVLAKVLVPVGIPIDGGLLGGVILSGVEGGLAFGGAAFPDPQTPLDILHDPAFDTDFPVNDDTIRDSVEPAVQNENLTWDNGFTLALSGKLTHAMAPAIVSGDVTIGMNVGLIPGRQGVKFLGSGDISAWGMEFAGAALLIDLTEVLEPTFDFAFETPQPGNPLAFLLPAQAAFEASLDTKGVIPGFGLGVATFVDRAASGALEVGQDFFDAALDSLATSLEGDHTRPLARLLLDTNGDGLVSGGEDQQVVTRDLVTSRSLALMGGGGLPSDPAAAGRAARVFVSDLLTAGSDLADDFDLSDVFTHADYAAFADLLGAGGEAIAALLGVVRDAVTEAGEAFWSEFDPSFHLRGMLQPIILGIPFGEPQHQVELIISKTGLGFGFDTSFGDISHQLCDRIIPFISGALCTLMTLGFEDHLGMTFELPLGGIIEGLFGGSGLPTIDPWSGDWAIELRGGLRWLDFEVGQMTGLVVAAGNPAFLDAHVQKLWEDPEASIDPRRIPIRTEQHYLDIVEHGGVLLTGRLLLPELLTDPVGLLSSLNLQVPDDIADMPDWVAAIADHLGRIDEPAAVQVFMPGFGSVLEADFDAPTDAGRLTPIGSGQSLADAFNDLSEAAYIEGVFDGTLLSLPFGRAVVTTGDQKLSVEGELPLTGLETRIDLDVEPMLGIGGMVDMPRAAATVTVDAAKVDDVLAGFGIPPIISHVGTSTSSYRMISPGYDPSSSDPLLRRGGIELATHLRINGLVDDADFRLAIAPPSGPGLPDVEGHASVDQIGPLGGVTIHDVAVDLVQRDGDFSIGIDGTAEILGASARVHGELNPDLTGELAVEFDSGGPSLMGFDITGGWVLAFTRPGGVLTATFSFDGEVVFPSWLSGPGGNGRAHATGSISTDGKVDLALDLSQISLFGFTVRDGTFHLTGGPLQSALAIDAKLDFLGAVLDVDGSLAIGAGGPSGSLALAFSSGSSMAFGPVTLKGTFAMQVGLTSARISVTGTADIPGLANAVGVSGTVNSNGTGSLALTGSSLGVKGFGITRHTTGSPVPPLASITRTLAATTMTVDARFSFLGSNLDVDGNLSLALAGPTGSLALTYNGSGNIPFSGWTLEGGVTIAITPSAGSIAINSKLDIAGLVNNATLTGNLNSSLLGSLSVSVGTVTFGAFSLTGTYTLSRSGSPAVVTLSASNVNLAWSGVSTFTVNAFSIGTDGHFDASVQGKTLSISAFTLTLPSFNLHVGAGATGVKLQIGQSSLSVSGIGTLTIPAFDVDTTGDFSKTLASTHVDLSALDLDGKLIFERQSGIFRLRVTGTTASNKATVSIPGLATVTVENFTIASDSTFDVAATSSRLGPDALSIRGASIRVKKTGTSLSTIKVTAIGGKLYMPVGDPITLPSLEIDGDASWSHTFTGTGINLGPALRTYNDPSFTLSLSGGVLRLELNAALGITVLAGSVSMELRTFEVASDGTFEGSVRGRLAMLGFTLASATFDVSTSGGAVRLRIPSSSPVSVDLGAVSASVYGSVYSDGRFDFSGSAAVDLTLLTVGLKGSATARLRNSGLSGTFTGKACALGVCVNLLSASIGNDGKLRVVIAGVTFYLPLFGAATIPSDTLAPLISQVSDITVVTNVSSGGTVAVSYTKPTATDNTDSSPTVTCTPASGSQFAVGSTTVTCTARDDAGNTSSRTFKVTVVDDNTLASGFTSVIGGDILIGGGGFSGGSLISGTLFSDPIPLGTTTADADGDMSWTVEIPRSARPGRHHIVCEGDDPSGDPHMLVFPVLIKGREPQGPPTSVPPVTGAAITTTTTTTGGPGGGLSGNLPFTGGGAAGTVPRALVLLLTGLLLMGAAQRRRETRSDG